MKNKETNKISDQFKLIGVPNKIKTLCKKGNSFLFLPLRYHLNYILSNFLHNVFCIIHC